MPIEARGGRTQRRVGEDGSVSTEHVGVLVVVGAVVAALLVVPIAPIIADWGRYAVCSLFAGSECVRPGARDQIAGPDPLTGDFERCDLAVSASGGEGNLDILWLSMAGSEGYEIVERSDGTTTVTYDRDVGFGANASTGGGLQVHFGEDSFNYHASADATGLWTMSGGQTQVFDSPEAAQQYADWHARVGSARDRYDHIHLVERINPLTWGGRNSVGARIDGFVADRSNDVAGWFGNGVDAPPTASSTIVHHAGGWDLSASASYGFATADANAAASTAGQIGWSEDTTTGEKVYYYQASYDVGLDAGFATDAPRFEAGATGNSLVAVTTDAHGNATRVDVTTHRVGEPGLDPSRLDDVTDLVGAGFYGRAGDGIDTSLYQTTMSLELEEPLPHAQIAGNLFHGGGGGQLTHDLFTDGEVHLIEYDVTDLRHGLDLGLGIIGIGGGGGAATVSTEQQLRNAHFLSDPGGPDRAWHPSATCVHS